MTKLLNLVRSTYRTWQSHVIGRAMSSQDVIVAATTQRRCMSDATSSQQANINPGDDLTLTVSCAQQIKRVVEAGSFLRVLVDSGGCSGFQYKFELDTALHDDDRVFERGGARVVIDEESLKLIRGSVIDYQQELIRSAFRVISNPQAEHGCSCGASFTVKL